MGTILVVGAADTGRAPMAAALLRRAIEEGRGPELSIESAGVVGHDGDPPTSEAVATMDQIGIDIADHVARSLTDELAAGADLLLAVDAGSAKVARARFPEAAARTHSLGELAGRARDLPDPFKMQIGAWLTYSREMDSLIRAALPRILALAAGAPEPPAPEPAAPPPAPEPPPAPVSPERAAAVGRMLQLADVMAQMPGVIDWGAARAQLLADLDSCAPAGPSDMALALGAVLRATLGVTASRPTAGQLAALRESIARLRAPVSAQSLAEASAGIARWAEL